MRVNGGDGCGHRHHSFERIAALADDGAAGFDGGGMRRADDAAAVAGAVQIHNVQFAAVGSKPRLRNSASALGNRPRNAL